MLARSYLSAKDLRISEKQRDALATLLGMMERDELPHTIVSFTGGMVRFAAVERGFNMAIWRTDHCCGTVGCIGGWMEKLSGEDLCTDYTPELDKLFHPDNYFSVEMTKITTSEAAAALCNYLTTGEPRWDEVLA